MSAFIANGAVTGGLIDSHPFWPSIDLDDVRTRLRIDSSVTTARLETAVVAALIEVNRELTAWRQARQAEGFEHLNEVPSEPLNGKPRQVHLYLRAVLSSVAAQICERYRGYDSTANGGKRAEDDAPSIDDYRRDQRWAIRDFLGSSRTTVELL
ncbi:head completion/stabilization protein [Pseudomonas cremoricolorata]|uniref:head completion/stabilization protein n=1 Tax=Pseudomonas cremoricolorata TaxID=157783 RepID=UPI0003F9301B|nr:head completion/stabilization protein [Pseudomonas cremoricolorata]